MKRFQNILFVSDPVSALNGAFDRAQELAKTNGARLTIMDVVEPVDAAVGRYDITALLQDRRSEELEALVADHANDRDLIMTQVRVGTPFIEIIRAVQQNGFDLVVKAAAAPTGPAQRLFGSTDLHLLRKCPCPVWIDRPGQIRGYRTILAAVNPLGSASDLDRLILDLATSLGEREGAAVHVAHAWRLVGESILRSGRTRIPAREVDQIVEGARAHHAQAFHALVTPYGYGPADPRLHLIKDAPAAAIVGLAESIDADLLVLGTVGRAGIAGLLIGNTAEDIVEQAGRPLLAVKPRDFVSPVRP
jgi:universal stress protein E